MKKLHPKYLLFLFFIVFVNCSSGYQMVGKGKVPAAILVKSNPLHFESGKIVLANDFVKARSSLRIQEKLLRKGTGLFSALFGRED